MHKYILKLYVAGHTPRAERSIADLRRLCARELGDNYEIVVVDVIEHPERAEQDHILATPTLIRELPSPRRRIIGDLSDGDKVLKALGLLGD